MILNCYSDLRRRKSVYYKSHRIYVWRKLTKMLCYHFQQTKRIFFYNENINIQINDIFLPNNFIPLCIKIFMKSNILTIFVNYISDLLNYVLLNLGILKLFFLYNRHFFADRNVRVAIRHSAESFKETRARYKQI